MRLSQHLVESQFFSFTEKDEFLSAVNSVTNEEELERISALLDQGLLPITSKEVLATMLGVNPGIIWSFLNKTDRHYRTFSIPKGKSERVITAPKVGLKIIQKWISVQLQKKCSFADHVFGFIPGTSHIEAAVQHTNASWVYSVDLEDFFPSTRDTWVQLHLQELGYDSRSAELITGLCCYRGGLAQGAPSSPVLSNISMVAVDEAIRKLALDLKLRVTRYADDITFSSDGDFPESLPEQVTEIFVHGPWKLATKKTHFSCHPNRLKVHGLLVSGNSVRLTKGYRNRIRAYNHLLKTKRCKEEDLACLSGHVRFSEQVESYKVD